MTGPEDVYNFTATADGPVIFSLGVLTDYATVAVLEQPAPDQCDPLSCVAFQYYTVVADLVAGQTYAVIVDGPNPRLTVYRFVSFSPRRAISVGRIV